MPNISWNDEKFRDKKTRSKSDYKLEAKGPMCCLTCGKPFNINIEEHCTCEFWKIR